jgi:glycosyltransferase involved in cell wall biosynthesis
MKLWLDEVKATARHQNVLIDKSMTLYDVMTAADLCVGYFSSVLLEALIVGIPVITLCDTPYEITPYAEYGLALRARSRDDFFALAQRLLYDEDTARAAFRASINANLRRFNYNNDGLATQRVAEYLLYN